MKLNLAIMVSALVVIAGIGAANINASSNSTYASWYGPGLYGNPMACGGVLKTNTWGVANKTLRCGTSLTMCYRKCVKVTVIDRGPYVVGREFDLTYPVLRAVGASGGVIKVRWWINR